MFFPMAKSSVECAARSFKLAFPPGSTIDIGPIHEAILKSVEALGIQAVMAYDGDDRAVTMEELAESGLSDDLPADGKEVIKVLTFDFKDDTLFAKAGDAKIPLARMKLTLAYKRVGEGSVEAEGAEKREYISDVFVVTKNEDVAQA
jgi:hypothetical protein